MRQTKIRLEVSKLYIIPSIIIILSIAINGFAFSPADVSGDLGFKSDPRRLIILGAAYLISLIGFFKLGSFGLTIIKKNFLYILFLIYALSSLFWSSHPINVIINFGHYTGYLLSIILLIYYYSSQKDKVYDFFAILLGIGLLLSIIVSILWPNIGIHPYTGRWQGVAGNPNTLGIICIISIWANIANILITKKGRWLNYLLMLITFVALFGARSTTSLIVSLFCIFSMIILNFIQKKTFPIKLIVLFFSSIALFVSLCLLYIYDPNIISIDGVLAILGKDRTLTGRTSIWEIAIKAIALKPYLGWSFDSNRSALEYFNFFRGQFHNGYLDLLVRGGIVAFVFFVLLVFQILYRIRKLTKYHYMPAMTWLVLLGCILVHNLTEASIMRETHLLWFMFVFIIFVLPSYSEKTLGVK